MSSHNKVKKLQKSSVIAALAAIISSQAATATTDNTASTPTLVELFTSEGCSSCPPADALAIKLQSRAVSGGPVIILGEHIDYWDHLGWKDQFSAAKFTARQRAYAAALGSNMYTPQVIVDGLLSAAGNEPRAVDDAINRSRHSGAKAHLTIVVQQSKAIITSDIPRELSGKRAVLYLAITEDNLASRVTAGENDGHTLRHAGVVRSLEPIGQTLVLTAGKPDQATVPIKLDKAWQKSNLHIVAFLQDATTLAVYGANQANMEMKPRL